MTRLFLQFYLGVLAVLFIAWYLLVQVSGWYYEGQLVRIVEAAQRGGMRLLVGELSRAPEGDIESALKAIAVEYDCDVQLKSLNSLPEYAQRRLADGADLVLFHDAETGTVIASPLADGEHAVVLGRLPEFTHYEDSLAGGLRLAASRLESSQLAAHDSLLQELSETFGYPVLKVPLQSLPQLERSRILQGGDIVFFQTRKGSFVVTPLRNEEQFLQFGPLPAFNGVERRAIMTTVVPTLLLAAVAIAVLLRPVAKQLRHVESAAKQIAEGDLSARVEERSMNSARHLAEAFNLMATRTETMLRTQRELLQAVSHEIRTPLARVRFATELIESAETEEERRNRAADLEAATQEIDDLVGEILSYVRMETAEPVLHPEQLALRDTIELMLPDHAAEHPKVRFETDQQLGDSTSVFADRSAFQRAIGNLLSNAGHFASGQVVVHVATSEGITVVDVDDDGPGIPEEERERVLEPFVRLDSDANSPHGVGLGLALVKRITVQHGGQVQILQSPLGGCRVRTTWQSAS